MRESRQEGRGEGRRLGGCAPVVAAVSPSRQGALQRRGKGEAAMERARARKNGVSACFGGASALRARPWAFAHPSYPLSCVHGDELAPV